jgi:hypothetical protein
MTKGNRRPGARADRLTDLQRALQAGLVPLDEQARRLEGAPRAALLEIVAAWVAREIARDLRWAS